MKLDPKLELPDASSDAPIDRAEAAIASLRATIEALRRQRDDDAEEIKRLRRQVAGTSPPTKAGSLRLDEVGITPEQAAELRARFASFAEDWNAREWNCTTTTTKIWRS